MSDIYERNVPESFPETREQPEFPEVPEPDAVFQIPPIRETADRWKKEVLDRIQFLKEHLVQVEQEKEGLAAETDRLRAELEQARKRIRELETQFADTLDTFNRLLNEVSKALEG